MLSTRLDTTEGLLEARSIAATAAPFKASAAQPDRSGVDPPGPLLYSHAWITVEARMPARNAGVAEVEKRIRMIRFRLNAFRLQQALYLTGTVASLGAALVVAAALRGQAVVFGVALWSALAAASAAGVYATLRMRSAWLTVDQTARWADRRARLDDRLATLLSRDAGWSSPRLRPVLVEQILSAAPRWDAETLSPRRVPRSLFALAAAFALLVATAFWARPPHPPAVGAPGARQTSAAGANAEDPLSQPIRPHPSANPDPRGQALTDPGQTSAEFGNEGAYRAASGVAPRVGGARDDTTAGSDPTTQGIEGRLAHRTDPGLNERLQETIQRALDAAAPDGRIDQHARASQTGAADTMATREGTATSPPPSSEAGTERGRAPAPAPNQASASRPRPGETGHGTRPAAADGGTAANDLFAADSTGREPGQAPSFSIKISALRAAAPSQHEAQRQSPPPDARFGTRIPSAAADVPFADESPARAPLHKPEVDAQHEAIVRRIFSRDE